MLSTNHCKDKAPLLSKWCWSPRSLLLLLLWASVAVHASPRQKQTRPPMVRLTVIDDKPMVYNAQAAVFGYVFPSQSFEANVMLPPDNPQLCQFPPSLVYVRNSNTNKDTTTNTTNTNSTEPLQKQNSLRGMTSRPLSVSSLSSKLAASSSSSSPFPIALVVEGGNCTFTEKAQVAAMLQEQFSEFFFLKYLIVYDNNATSPNEILAMSPNQTMEEAGPEISSIGLLLVSYNAGQSILSKIETERNKTALQAATAVAFSNQTTNTTTTTGAVFYPPNPVFMGNGNDDWHLSVFGEVFNAQDNNDNGKNDGSNNSDHNFKGQNGYESNVRDSSYWSPFILFSLLIVPPCVRAGYLWYGAGGHITFRRNPNTGRITGLQYIRPIPDWFASSGVVGYNHGYPEDTKQMTLTEAQVNELPELIFYSSTAATTKTNNQNHHNNDASNKLTDGDGNSAGAAIDDLHMIQAKAVAFDHDPNNKINDKNHNNQVSSSSSSGPWSTTCTMCSICIDAFENGEAIRVLPTCRHGFHMECIKPWLTERQGFCPLCKTNVLINTTNTNTTNTATTATTATSTTNSFTEEDNENMEDNSNNNNGTMERDNTDDSPV